eukprot:9815146-Ditylum_brightwellii.AAC.1
MPWVDKPKSILGGYLAGQTSGLELIDLTFGISSPYGKLSKTFLIWMKDVPSDPWFPMKEDEVVKGKKEWDVNVLKIMK